MAVAAQNSKYVTIVPPQAIVDNASWTTAEVDTAGYDYAKIVVHLGATDIAMTALAVTESDTSASGHANVTGLVFGTSTTTDGATSNLPAADDDNKFFICDIDLRGRKRYLDLTATAGNGTNGTFLTAWVELSRADETPVTASQRGADQVLRV